MTHKLPPFTTPRLSVSGWGPVLENPDTRAKLEATLAAFLTPPVLAPLPPSLQLDSFPGGITGWVTTLDAQSDVSRVEQRSDGAMIGLLILGASPEPPDPPCLHIGYLLAERVWGQGLASELVQGLVGATDVTLIGGVARDNPASARVLQKAGFSHDPARSTPDTDMFIRH